MADDRSQTGATFSIVSEIIRMLEPFPVEDRLHILQTIATWFRVDFGSIARVPNVAPTQMHTNNAETKNNANDRFLGREEVSAKDFMIEKDPRTDVERVACLAYYLTHYRETPHFRTIDLSRLNTEAAQRKFSNAAVAANNAMRDGFFVHSPKAGSRQLSAMGERFVQSLPNRDAAEEVRQKMSSRRGRRGGPSHEIEDSGSDADGS